NSNEPFDPIDLTESETTEVLYTFFEDTIDVPAILIRELVP
ncbi:4541_t:CDS:1, partial [Scutellospora calospora]